MFKKVTKAVFTAVSASVLALSASMVWAAPEKDATLDKILTEKVIKVGVILSIPPNGFKDNDGNPDGYDVDVAKMVAEKLGVKLQIVDTNSADRIPNLRTGKVDIIIGSFSRTAERAKVVDFSDPYITAVQMAMVVNKDSPIQGVKDLDGKTVAMTKGSTGEMLFRNISPKSNSLPFDSLTQAMMALKQGQVDAYVDDGNVLNYQAKLDNNVRVIVDEAAREYIDYNSIGVRRGDQQLLNWMNNFVFEINTTGVSKKIYRKWFGTEMPAPLNPQI